MKKIITIALVMIISIANSQTGHRKTRSDKGGTHKHTASYSLKKAAKSSSTPKKTRKKK